jgi:hypothetical protein
MVPESIEDLERRINELRTAVRRSLMSGDRVQTRALRADLRQAESAWESALADLEDQGHGVRPVERAVTAQAGSLLPLREQVHQALTLLTVPAAPKLIIAVHEAFFSGEMISARLTSLRRDEQRSYESAPNARPYYLCAALTHDLLTPARGLLAVSTWSMADRIVGPLSPRVHYLKSAIRVAEYIARLDDPGPATRLLWRFSANIPGASEGAMSPDTVARTARAELVIHDEADQYEREESGRRAVTQLPAVQQLFGSRLGVVEEDVG